MKVLKITAIGTVLAGLVGLAVVLAPSVSAQSFDRLFAGAQGGSRGRALTILGGRGGELGVSIVDGKNGVEIDEVHADSAAEKAGLKRGDVIKSFNGQDVQDTNTLRNRVASAAPGSSAALVVIRDGSERTLTVKLDEVAASKSARNDTDPDSNDKAALGVSVAPLTPELASRAGLPRDVHGLVVKEVNPDGRAAEAGVQTGDVIQEVNRQPVQSVDELRAAVRRTSDRPVLLLVNREGRDLFLTVRPS